MMYDIKWYYIIVELQLLFLAHTASSSLELMTTSHKIIRSTALQMLNVSIFYIGRLTVTRDIGLVIGTLSDRDNMTLMLFINPAYISESTTS